MPPDQADLFASMPAPRRAVAVVVPAQPEPDGIEVMGVMVPLDQAAGALDQLHRSITGPLAYRHTLCVAARELATSAMAVERLKGRAVSVLRAWQAQEIAVGSAKAEEGKR